MRTGRPLIVVAALSIATTGAAYAFGPSGKPKSKPKPKPASVSMPFAAAGAGMTSATTSCDPDPRRPKRELRGVWIATVKNIDWPSRAGLPIAQQKSEYTRILDNAAARRLNAVFVQVRPASDAFYKSPYEPWSQWLSGAPGKNPGWDPLPFLIEEAHKRGLEFHAWFNPYRAAASDTTPLPPRHPARLNPGWTVKHEGMLYYNPGLPAVREHVVKVITDVVKRYDVDGVHFDDYFYPYPGKGTPFADSAAFSKYGKGKSLAAWRRGNVNKLVAEVDKAVHDTKNYVKFGISPFGIWRNKSNDPTGSATSGMSAYDSIYADARHWIRKGTVDYVLPQLYWPRGFKTADYNVLAPWWAKEVKGTDVQLYIGQALYQVGTTVNPAWKKPGELVDQINLNRKIGEIKGEVFFSAKQLGTNPLRVLDRISSTVYARPALLPLMKDRGGQAPPPPADLKQEGGNLTWASAQGATGYAVYRVQGEPGACTTADARHLLAVEPAVAGTRQSFPLRGGGTYLVTSLDRLTNESKPTILAVKGS
ncbi:glycoside hydrolase family 10 protein [Sinosporangium siamense]|uniref:Glycosyl hydrolase n=1 Tax=Sinosporangium siamense TaxID=1367973 RepID=A0A919VAF3_9ACTN|nr:family 10 glycosylhydrolase [Sinosporangium siamense]GII95357.1 glycosyl hydrolase [Sinosporangium siamense]